MSFVSTLSAASINGFQNPTVVNGATLLQILTSPNPTASGYFGSALDATEDGSRIIIGQTGAFGIGRAYIYLRSGNLWTLETSLTNSVAGGGFGTSVSISGDGNFCIIGAVGTGTDYAYVYSRSGTTWSLVYTYGPGNSIGYDVSINYDGSWAVVGQPNFAPAGFSNTGRITILYRVGSIWSVHTNLNASAPNDSKWGASVSINYAGNLAFLGLSGSVGLTNPIRTLRTGNTWSVLSGSLSGNSNRQVNGPYSVYASKTNDYCIYSAAGKYLLVNTSINTASFQGTISTVATASETVSFNSNATSALLGPFYYDSPNLTFERTYISNTSSANIASVVSSDANIKLVANWRQTTGNVSEAGQVYIFT